MIDSELRAVIDLYIRKHGRSALLAKISDDEDDDISDVLTIVCNSGLHPLYSLHRRGEIFFASEGSLDFSSEDAAVKTLTSVLQRVAIKLKERSWRTVFIVPFGPAVLSMQIKALVYRVLNIDSIDVLHAGEGVHYDVRIDIRDVAVNADTAI